eukprot:Selendium_serpulae@DN3640_c1_g1_i1.p1
MPRSDYAMEALRGHERFILLDDLALNGVQQDVPVTADELVNKLKHSRRTFDDATIRKQFAAAAAAQSATQKKADGTGTQVVTGKDFVDEYVRRRREVDFCISSSSSELRTAEKLLHQAERSLRAASAAEERDAYYNMKHNVSEESKLTVQVISLKKVKGATPGMHLKVHLECQHQEIETTAQVFRSGEVFWNELVSFQIGSRDGDLKISLFKVDTYNGIAEPFGKCSIVLEELGDQKKVDIAKPVAGTTDKEAGTLSLSCQWVHSKKTLYLNYVRDLTARRNKSMKEVETFTKELKGLNAPFVAAEAEPVALGQEVCKCDCTCAAPYPDEKRAVGEEMAVMSSGSWLTSSDQSCTPGEWNVGQSLGSTSTSTTTTSGAHMLKASPWVMAMLI